MTAEFDWQSGTALDARALQTAALSFQRSSYMVNYKNIGAATCNF